MATLLLVFLTFVMFSKTLLGRSSVLSAVLRTQPLSRAVRPTVLPGFRVSSLDTKRSFSSARVLREEENPREPGRVAKPTGTVFVGNLPYSVTAEQLQEVLSQFGRIQAVNMNYGNNGRPSGSCFVFFEKVQDAIAFVEADKEDPIYLLDRDINIQHAINSTGNLPTHQLMTGSFVGEEADVREWFKEFEHSITSVRIPRDRMTGQRSGLLFIQFADADAAARAREAVSGKITHEGQRMHFRFARQVRPPEGTPFFSRQSKHRTSEGDN
ncbi:hypothetical protein F5I97DRAFT_436801 [Phlebopus sp. FC_14]|nr:hypothetical protein F5I97DRAFT_436801 [Phlebopus sp. FC_14]